MRRPRLAALPIAGALMLAFVPALAAPADLTVWFVRATAYHDSTPARRMAAPDFLPGTSMQSMECGGGETTALINQGIWELKKYDRTHRLALAAASTDQCSVALFAAPAPAVRVPNADLSRYRTGRGLHIGSTYAQVLAVYGGRPVNHGPRFVAAYYAFVPGLTDSLPRKQVQLPEQVTLVLVNERVSSITISVDLGSLY